MGEIKIRNGGFELGVPTFWGASTNAIISAIDTSHKYGSYAGKALYNGTALDGFLPTDYSKVKFGELFHVGGYYKPDAARYCGLRIYEYNADLDYLGYHEVFWESLTHTVWTWKDGFYSVPEGVAYIRPAFLAGGLTATDYLLIDDAVLTKLGVDSVHPLEAELSDDTVRAASFDTYAAKVDLIGCTKYVADLRYRYTAGTATSIDVYVMEDDATLGAPVEVGHFSAIVVNTNSNERIVLDKAIGKDTYLDCVVVNASSLSFKAGVVLKGLR